MTFQDQIDRLREKATGDYGNIGGTILLNQEDLEALRHIIKEWDSLRLVHDKEIE